MSDLVAELVKLYGISLLIGAALIACFVWVLAHFAAASGTPVSVLWGLVKYTKSSADPSVMSGASTGVPAREPPAIRSESASSIPGTTHGLDPKSAPEVVTKLRSDFGLRDLRPLESDRPIGASPLGTFFFVFGGALHKSPTNPDGSLRDVTTARASRFPTTASYFEVHHRPDGQLLLLGYSGESDADRIRSNSRVGGQTLTISPHSWGSSTSLVTVLVDCIVSSTARDLEIDQKRTLKVLDLTLR